MVFDKRIGFLAIGILTILGVLLLLGLPTVQATDFVVLDGYTGNLISTKGLTGSVPFSLYFIEFPEWSQGTGDLRATILNVGDNAQFSGNEIYAYYGVLGSDDVKLKQKLLAFKNEDAYSEWVLFYDHDGKIDFSKSVLAQVPVDVDDYYYGYCFHLSFNNITQRGNCDYYVTSLYDSVSEVLPYDIEWTRAIINDVLTEKKEELSPPAANIDDFLNPGSADNPQPPAVPQTAVYEEIIQTSDSATNNDEPSEEVTEKQNYSTANSTNPFFFRLPKKNLNFFGNFKREISFSTEIFSESFESPISSSWYNEDEDAGKGEDKWGIITGVSSAGSKSAWSASFGEQEIGTTFTEGFDIPFTITNWTAWDNTGNSKPYWAYSTAKSNSSAYAAGANNPTPGVYANSMDAWMTRNGSFNASSWTSARLTFDLWNKPSSGDKLQVVVNENGDTDWFIPTGCEYTFNTLGWNTAPSCDISSTYLTSNFQVGFRFFTNSSGTNEGPYIDNVKLYYSKTNQSEGKYDDYMNAILITPPIPVQNYTNVDVSMKYKVTTADASDYLKVEVSGNGSSYTSLGQFSSSNNQFLNLPTSFDSTASGNYYIKYKFFSNTTNHSAAGAYIDDIKLVGDLKKPQGALCSVDDECQSGDCGGADTDYFIHCNNDGSQTVNANNLIYANTCGGAGTLSQTVNDGSIGSCSSNKVCDDEAAYTAETFDSSTISVICKNPLYSSCSSDSQCWNDLESGSSNTSCKGTPSICTTGNEGAFCDVTSQCDSGLTCDTTNHICSTGTPSGQPCTSDSQCNSKICIYTTATAGVCETTHNPLLDVTDTWIESNSNNESSATDGRLFAGETAYPRATKLRESTDMLCYDFNEDGTLDACYYDIGLTSNVCNTAFSQTASVPIKQQCDIDSPNGCKIGIDNGTSPRICPGSGCSVNTSNPIPYKEVHAFGFTNCGSPSLKEQYQISNSPAGDSFEVINPKFYMSNYTLFNESNVNNPEYHTVGYDGQNWDNFYFSHTCTNGKFVDVLSEFQKVYTANGVIPEICKKAVGQSCSQNSECLYNNCQGTCQSGIGINGYLKDEFGTPIVGKEVRLTSCTGSQTTLKSSTTDSDGRFKIYHTAGSYKLKATYSWGETTYIFPEGPCYNYTTGFNNIWLQQYTKANIHGKAVDPQGFASNNLTFQATTCAVPPATDAVLASYTTSADGVFSLLTDAGKQKLKVDIGGTKYPLTDASGNACVFQYGDVDYGTQIITNNCESYNNTCSDDNTRLFDCANDSLNGCSCKSQYCEAGCTEGASICNPIGTGTFKVQVLDLNGNAVVLAPVYVDNQFAGKTNGFGKKDVNVKHGSHSIKTDCPSAAVSQTKSAYINGDTKYETFKLNCPTQQKGDLIVSVENVNGNPIGNVYLFMEDSNSAIGLTDGFGSFNLPNLAYGEQIIRIGYKLSDESDAKSVTKKVIINQAKTKVSFVVLAPGDQGYSSYSALEAVDSVEWIDDVVKEVSIIIVGSILPPVDFAVSSADYCSCVYDGADTAINQCINDITPCASYFLAGTTDPFVSTNTCVSNVQNHTSKLDKCGLDFLFVGVSVIPTPVDNIAKGYVKAKKLEKAANKVAKLTYDAQNGYTKIEKTVKLIEKTTDSITTLEDKYVIVKKLTVDSQTGKEVFKGGVNILKDTTKFTELGADAALDFTKAIKNYHGVTEEGATSLAKNIEKYRPEDAADVFNAMGNLLSKNKDIGLTIDAAGTVGISGDKPAAKLVLGIEEGGESLKGHAEELLTANKDIDEFVQFPQEGKGLGDLELTGGRRKQVKSKDLKLYQNQETSGIKIVSDGVTDMIEITKNFPNPTGKHLLQFHDLTLTQKNEILSFLDSEAKKVGINNILSKVDVVTYK